MTRDQALSILRRKGMHLVADVLDSESPRSVIVRLDYDRQVGLLGSYLVELERHGRLQQRRTENFRRAVDERAERDRDR